MAQEIIEQEEDQVQTNLFRTDDPAEVVEKATKVADALKKVLVDKGMIAEIAGKQHVKVEGWQTLGSMLGVTAVLTKTEELPEGGGYKAYVEARKLSNEQVVGRAEALCTRGESRWKERDDYAVLSMAQTRATSKALRGPLGFVVQLAGYNPTPAEEITEAPQVPKPQNARDRTPFNNDKSVHTSKSGEEPATQAQLNYIEQLGGDPKKVKTKAEASKAIEELK